MQRAIAGCQMLLNVASDSQHNDRKLKQKNMNITEYISTIRKQVEKDDLDAAIKSLGKLLDNSPNLDELIMQSARLSALKQQTRIGVLDYDIASTERNKIRNALIEFIREIEGSLEKNIEISKEVNRYPSKIKQIHSGSGDNIGGDKIINVHAVSKKLFLSILIIITAFSVFWFWRNKQLEKSNFKIVSHVKDTSTVAPQSNTDLTTIEKKDSADATKPKTDLHQKQDRAINNTEGRTPKIDNKNVLDTKLKNNFELIPETKPLTNTPQNIDTIRSVIDYKTEKRLDSSQTQKIRFSKNSFTNPFDAGGATFPVHTFSLLNGNNFPLIINGVRLEVISYFTSTKEPQTRVLYPIDMWDIDLKIGKGTYTYQPRNPIYISPHDAVRISLRFMFPSEKYRDVKIPPNNVGRWEVKVTFLTDKDEILATSEAFQI